MAWNRSDDMVIRPSLGQFGATQQVKAREERELAKAQKKRGGLVSRIVKARLAKRAALRIAGGFAQGGIMEALGVNAARTAGMAAVLNPVGLLITTLVVTTAVVGRIVSGSSFENMGQEVNNVLLGDMDDEARAAAGARAELAADGNLAAIAGMTGQGGKVDAGIKRIFDDIKRMKKIDQLGRSAFMSDPDFQVNGTVDMLILRAHNALVRNWNGSGGPAALERIRQKLGDRSTKETKR